VSFYFDLLSQTSSSWRSGFELNV